MTYTIQMSLLGTEIVDNHQLNNMKGVVCVVLVTVDTMFGVLLFERNTCTLIK
jgi:hypothetical protein